MTKLDIDHIDNIIQSWKYSMCVKCAMNCKGKSLYDLYLSSSNCHRKKHKVTNRSSLLYGYGHLKAAVEYINATEDIIITNILRQSTTLKMQSKFLINSKMT